MFTLLTVFIAAVVCLLLFNLVATLISLTVNKVEFPEEKDEKDMALIITAYKSMKLIPALLKSISLSKYQNYHVYVVADACEGEDLNIESDKVTVLLPITHLNSKLKSIRYAIDNFVRQHDTSIILDPDNLVHRDFLSKVNIHRTYYPAVQGRRVAKNMDTPVAALDAAGELYHNYSDKYVPYKLGSSSGISGSGMALETGLLQEFLNSDLINQQIDGVISGEDKMLANYIIKKDYVISYEYDAIVYDEKLEDKNQIQNQRSRWLKSYFDNLKASLAVAFLGVKNKSWNQVLFGVYNSFPPLFLLCIGTAALILVSLFISPVSAGFLIISLVFFVCNFLLVLQLGEAPKPVWKALEQIPVFMLEQVKALAYINRTKKDFLITDNSKEVSIEELNKG